MTALCGSPRLRDGAYGERVQRRAASWESALFGPPEDLRANPFAQLMQIRGMRVPRCLHTFLLYESRRARHEARLGGGLDRRGAEIDPSVRATSSPRPPPGILDGEAKHPNTLASCKTLAIAGKRSACHLGIKRCVKELHCVRLRRTDKCKCSSERVLSCYQSLS